MNSVDIPRLEWADFLQRFLVRHREGLVNVRIESRVSVDSADARERTLSNIEVDEDAGHACLAVETRDHAGRRAAHSLPDVTRLRLLQEEGGAETALFAESEEARLLVHFVLALPGAVDGIDAPPERPGW
jgi:hypothetical protein